MCGNGNLIEFLSEVKLNAFVYVMLISCNTVECSLYVRGLDVSTRSTR